MWVGHLRCHSRRIVRPQIAFPLVRYFHPSVARLSEDYYSVLGVPQTASQSQIKQAYYKIAKEMHPDLPGNKGKDEVKQKFARISAAYNVLGDPVKRDKYDKFGHTTVDENEEEDLKNFSDMYGNVMGNDAELKDFHRGDNIELQLSLTFEEAAKGVQKKMEYKARGTCAACTGSGAAPGGKVFQCTACNGNGYTTAGKGLFQTRATCSTCKGFGSIIDKPCAPCKGTGTTLQPKKINVKIPPGVDTDHQVRIKDRGHQGNRNSGKHGAAYICITVEDHPHFYRVGEDVYTDVNISVAQAVLGDTITVHTLDGSIELKVPPGVQHDEKRILKGRGIGSREAGKLGNFYVKFKVVIPKSITKEQADLMFQFGRDDIVCPQPYTTQWQATVRSVKRFFNRVKE